MELRTATRVAWVMCGSALVLVVAALVLVAAADGPAEEGYPSRLGQAISLLGLLGPAVLGGLIAARRPANPYGWLWCAYALGWAAIGFTEAWVTFRAAAGPGALAWATPVAWVGSIAFRPVMALTGLILLLFPDGRPPSRRWGVVARGIVVVGVASTAAEALLQHPDPLPAGPVALAGGAAGVAQVVAGVGITVLFLAVLVSALSLLLRFRRARGQQRQQLKWLAYGGAVLAAVLALNLVGLEPPGLWDILLETLSFVALYVGVGMAVLRYRLYDIDRLINRTLVYGLLTALLAGVYAGLVLLLGLVFGDLGGEPPSWAVAAATLAAATLFQPARRRVQDLVDRRFNRRRHDAALSIAAFSARLRDQVDLGSVTAELVRVVDQTIEPTSVWLWLRPAPPRGDR